MTRIRNDLIHTLWRGHDPFSAVSRYKGPSDLQGWASQHRYLSEAITTHRPSIIVEVGVWKGGSTIHMASKLKEHSVDGVVIAVDTWLGAWDHWVKDQWFPELGMTGASASLFEKFMNNVRTAGLAEYIVPLPLDSINAAQVLQYFGVRPDMVHIDAGHDYDAVKGDLEHWWPALKPGGILIGDDYRDGNDWPEVKRAFDVFFGPIGLTPIENISDKCRVYKPVDGAELDEGASCPFDQVESKVAQWRETCRLEFASLVEDDSISLQDMIRRYVDFLGPKWEGARTQIMDKIVSKLNDGGAAFTRNDIFGPNGEVLPTSIADLGHFATQYLRGEPPTEFKRFELLPQSTNPFSSMALPGPLNKNMAKVERPSLSVFRTTSVDLFVTPLGYQLCDKERGIYWPAASTRAYSSSAFSSPAKTADKPIIIVQDTFEGTNYSHFLFDWIPRLSHFLVANLEDASSCTFLMGGAPGDFHKLIIEQLCKAHSLKQKQFVFPTGPEMWRLEGPVYFFSDVRIEIMHPAHMAHERSMEVIRKITTGIATSKRGAKRLYISRSDTPLRRLANEAELWPLLKSRGFDMVRLAEVPFRDQLELIRGAEVIVAPHGMGLTHIAFHDETPLIVELHHPVVGTDAYAFIAHARGFRYHAIIGKSVDPEKHHFEVSVEDVMVTLFLEGISPSGTLSDTNAEVKTIWFAGMQTPKAYEVDEIPRAAPSVPVMKHVRADPTSQPDNNVGWMEVRHLERGVVYAGACDVWIPFEFGGKFVVLQSEDLNSFPKAFADLGRRNQWQTISLSGVAKEDVANFVLRLDARGGDLIYSSRWRMGAGTGL